MSDARPDSAAGATGDDFDQQLSRLARELGGAPLDAATGQRLAQARRAALDAATRRAATGAGARPRRLAGWPVPLATFATAAVLGLALSLRAPSAAPPDLASDPGAAPYVYAGEDAALIEELDFVYWLDERDHAG